MDNKLLTIFYVLVLITQEEKRSFGTILDIAYTGKEAYEQYLKYNDRITPTATLHIFNVHDLHQHAMSLDARREVFKHLITVKRSISYFQYRFDCDSTEWILKQAKNRAVKDATHPS
jgi:hypothetical protein